MERSESEERDGGETLLLRDSCIGKRVRTEEEEIGHSDNIKELLRIAISVE
jgi:hypothetical protein